MRRVSEIVIDTSGWISFFNGIGRPLIEDALSEGRAVVTPIVVAELLSGRLSPRRRLELIDLIESLRVFPAPLEHWIRVGDLRAHLRGRGLSVSIPDAQIAQCCLELDAELITEDRVFVQIARHSRLRLPRTS